MPWGPLPATQVSGSCPWEGGRSLSHRAEPRGSHKDGEAAFPGGAARLPAGDGPPRPQAAPVVCLLGSEATAGAERAFPDQDSLPGTKPRRQAPAGSHPGPGHTPYAWGSVSPRASWPPPQPPWRFSWGRCVRPRAGQLPGALVCAQGGPGLRSEAACQVGPRSAVAGAGAEPGAGGAAEALG